MKYLVILLIALLACAGCTQRQTSTPAAVPVQKPAENVAPQITRTTEPTEEPTFISPGNRHRQYIEMPTTPTVAPDKDPIIGTWTMKGSSYAGTATVSGIGQGSLTVKVTCLSKTIPFAWSNQGQDGNGNTRYHVALSDGSGQTADAVLDQNGKLTSPILPEGAYLVKE